MSQDPNCVEMFIVPKVIKDYIGTIFFGKLCSPIDFRREDISIRASADEQGSIYPHEGEGEALVELPGGISLIPTSLPGNRGPNPLDLPTGCLVQTPQSFHCHWDYGVVVDEVIVGRQFGYFCLLCSFACLLAGGNDMTGCKGVSTGVISS